MTDTADQFPTFSRLQAFRRSLTPVRRAETTAGLMALLSMLVGVGIVLVDGVFNTRFPQFREEWIVFGTLGFTLPGGCFALAWWGLRTTRRWPLVIGAIGAALQAIAGVATITVVIWYTGMPYLLLVLGVALGVALEIILIWQLRRAWPWLGSDATVTHGFNVIAAEPVEAEMN